MGSQNSMQFIQNPLPKDYKSCPDQPNVYISIVDHNKLQKHTISISNKSQLAYEQQMFIFRRCNSDHIVTAKYFQNITINQVCANSYEVTYFTEHPQKRLIDISQFQQSQGYSYLIDCLKGFQILAQKVGWFKVTQKMIVFDRDGKIKVWMNQNFASAVIKRTDKILSQKQFLHKIVSLFDSKIQYKNQQQGYYWSLIVKHLSKSSKRITVQQALNALILLAPNHLQTARSFISNIKQIKSQKCQNKGKSSAKMMLTPKNSSATKKTNSNINSPAISFDKKKQKSLKGYKKVSQQSQTVQQSFGRPQPTNRNTIATLQLHSPIYAKFTVNNNSRGQKIVINHIQPNKRFYSQDSTSHTKNYPHYQVKQTFINDFNNPSSSNSQHRVFRSHGKEQVKIDHNGNSRKSMDQIIYMKKSTQSQQTSMFSSPIDRASRPPILTSNYNRNTVNINPDFFKLYYQNPKDTNSNLNNEINRNNHILNKHTLKSSHNPNFNPKDFTKIIPSKISKTNFQPLGKRFIRKKYESHFYNHNQNPYHDQNNELITKPSSPNKETNQKNSIDNLDHGNTLKNLDDGKNGWFKKQLNNNETARYFNNKHQNQNNLSGNDIGRIKKAQRYCKQSNQSNISTNFQKKKPLDQLHTIKSIIYSDANVSQTLSLQLFENGLSKQFLNRLDAQQLI